MQTTRPDFGNVCLPCSNIYSYLKAMDGVTCDSSSPCSSNRSSTTSNSSVRMEFSYPETVQEENRLSLNIERCILNVGATAQIRRRNSSLSRKKRPIKIETERFASELPSPSEEWSQTFVGQDGLLTTNFCSTEL